MLTRTFARDGGLREGDEILVTKLDHDANVAPWLELAHDLGIVVRNAGVTDDLELDVADLERQLTDRTKVVAFPAAANSVGTAPDVRRIVELAHDAGALAWVDAVHYGSHGPIDVAEWGCDVLVCSPYKFYGPHLGLAFGRADLLESWRPYKVRPSANDPVGRRFETGTLPHELLAGFVGAVDYLHYGLPTMEGRVPTFCFNVPGLDAQQAAVELAARDLAVWWGDYYAWETMRHLGLEGTGAVRAGIVHYNTAEEVDRLLSALGELCES
jgi:selenocysteine lyase/cysteine desulfurase